MRDRTGHCHYLGLSRVRVQLHIGICCGGIAAILIAALLLARTAALGRVELVPLSVCEVLPKNRAG